MRKIFKITLGLVIMTSLLFSCKNKLSLQQFFVEQQEVQDVISFDLSSSLLAAAKNLQSEDEINTLKSLKKINILAYQIKDSTNDKYKEDIKRVKEVLNQDEYAELMRYGKGSQGAKVYLVDDGEKINEIIIFANDKEKGWLLVRVLGNDMKPEKIMQLVKNIDFDKNDFDLSKLKDIIGKKN